MLKAGDIVHVKAWAHAKPRQRAKVIAIADGFAWIRLQNPKQILGAHHAGFTGSHHVLGAPEHHKQLLNTINSIPIPLRLSPKSNDIE